MLAALIVLLALTVTGYSAQRASPPVLPGACYCRRAKALNTSQWPSSPDWSAIAGWAEEFCDDWFWLERRPCWNWGYGG